MVGRGYFVEVRGDLAHDEGVGDAMEAVFPNLVAPRVVRVKRICAYVLWQRESVESGVEEGDVFGRGELFERRADEGERRGVVPREISCVQEQNQAGAEGIPYSGARSVSSSRYSRLSWPSSTGLS